MQQALFIGVLFGASVTALVLTALARQADVHMAYAHLAVAAVTSLLLAGAGMLRVRAYTKAGAPAPAIAGANAQAMALIWCWGAVALFATYGPGGVLAWKEWWHFFIAFAVATAICFAFAVRLGRAGAAGTYEEGIDKVSQVTTIVQLAGMLIVMIGLIVDGKMTRFLNPRYTDWAGNNIFFAGAAGLAALSAFALINSRKR